MNVMTLCQNYRATLFIQSERRWHREQISSIMQLNSEYRLTYAWYESSWPSFIYQQSTSGSSIRSRVLHMLSLSDHVWPVWKMSTEWGNWTSMWTAIDYNEGYEQNEKMLLYFCFVFVLVCYSNIPCIIAVRYVVTRECEII